MTDTYGHVTPPSAVVLSELKRLEKMGHQPVRYGDKLAVYRCARCKRYAIVTDHADGSMTKGRCNG